MAWLSNQGNMGEVLMPDKLYFVSWCDPAKYNVGPEQEYDWFSEEQTAMAKFAECQLAKYENVYIFVYRQESRWGVVSR